jgi:hypothetical protein
MPGLERPLANQRRFPVTFRLASVWKGVEAVRMNESATTTNQQPQTNMTPVWHAQADWRLLFGSI